MKKLVAQLFVLSLLLLSSNLRTSAQCDFIDGGTCSYYINGVQDFSYCQQDIYIFRLTNKQNYHGSINSSIIDSIAFNNANGLSYNIFYFTIQSTNEERLFIKNQIRNDSLFEFEFPVITKFPNSNRAEKKWMYSNDMINISFRSANPSPSSIQYLIEKYNLLIRHEPNSQLPRSGDNSWTYSLILNPVGCKERNAINVSKAIYQEDSNIVKFAEPWLEPSDEAIQTNDPYFQYLWHINNTGQCLPNTNPTNNGSNGADCKIESAWQLGFTGNSIKVAVIDKSIFQSIHPDISSKYINGYDWCDMDNDVSSSSGPSSSSAPHGQACAGIIGAIANNNIGITGVAYDAQIIPLITYYANSYLAFQDAFLKNADVM